MINQRKIQYGFVVSSLFYLIINLFVDDRLLDWAGGLIAIITIVFILNGFDFKNLDD